MSLYAMTTTGRSLFLCALVGLVVLVGLGAPKTLHAQIQKDTTHWNDADLYQDEEHGSPSYFSVGGGLVAHRLPGDGDCVGRQLIDALDDLSQMLAVDVVEQGDAGRAVGIVLERRDLGGNFGRRRQAGRAGIQ